MIVKIIAIGSELLSGSSTDTNSQFIINALKSVGISVASVKIVGDEIEAITGALASENDADILLITGGLGPTHDDRTVKAAAQYFDSAIVFSEVVMQHIQALFEVRGIAELSEANRRQALVPEKAELIPNYYGTAPGLIFKKGKTVYYFMPGVPVEMERMFAENILPILQTSGTEPILSAVIRTTGVPESVLFQKIEQWIEINQDLAVSILPHFPEVHIVITKSSPNITRPLLDKKLDEVTAILGDDIYGYDADTLESVVAKQLLKNNLTIAIAESCTGGLIAHRLTNISGSSAYFQQGIICYSNRSKIENLGVREKTLADFGAVSRQTAQEMAVNIRRIANSDIGLSTTGIAGPTGGSPEKPVGTVFIGLASGDHKGTFHFRYNRDRLSNKIYFSQMALNQLRLDMKASYE
ncbi:MAG TPA: competence/damage-inducible protein A [Candidatus Marinimicrobia bacterium]|nr:competence/damage-inducible protein A [Candidatus Neomarinimicrobiota bacterium]